MGILMIILMIVVHALAASKFEKIANMKGHQGYFWWCFCLGMVGWAMIIALPDRKTAQGTPITDDALPDL